MPTLELWTQRLYATEDEHCAHLARMLVEVYVEGFEEVTKNDEPFLNSAIKNAARIDNLEHELRKVEDALVDARAVVKTQHEHIKGLISRIPTIPLPISEDDESTVDAYLKGPDDDSD